MKYGGKIMRGKRFDILLMLLLIASIGSAQKEKVTIHISLDSLAGDNTSGGCYSISVCDANIVHPDTINPSAMAELLLCSELKGEIEYPNYYFSDSKKAMNDLDLLMMTQGWRRYDLKDLLNKNYPDIRYNIEEEQTISGVVESDKKKSIRNLQLVMFNPRTLQKKTFELGDSARFTISGIDYMDGEALNIEVFKTSGSTKGLTLKLDEQHFPDIQAPGVLKSASQEPAKEIKEFAIQSEKQRMYMNADKMIELPDIEVKGKRQMWRNRRKMVGRGIAEGDPEIERFPNMESMIRSLGIIIKVGDDGVPYFGKQTPTFNGNGFTLTPIYVDDLQIEQQDLWDYLPTQISQIEYLTPNDAANIVYGSEAVTSGCLLVYLKDGSQAIRRNYTSNAMQRVRQMGYRPPAEFYAPQYPLMDKSEYARPDYRTTLYWNPKLKIGDDGKADVEFYSSDVSKDYLITVEGVSDNGVIVSKCYKSE